MVLQDIACVLAHTARSQAYIQALVRNGIYPAKCLILPDGAQRKPQRRTSNPYFNTGEPILETLVRHEIKYELMADKDINAAGIKHALEKLPQKYIVYSGYGGYILKPHLFQMGKRWIHVHAGILPQYRGSTTVYYSLLRENRLGATAIFLNERIDEGSIIAEEGFPPPERGELLDYIYDPYMRSSVLVKALQLYIQNGAFPEVPQRTEDAETYYIIHPVLKHIAILGNGHGAE